MFTIFVRLQAKMFEKLCGRFEATRLSNSKGMIGKEGLYTSRRDNILMTSSHPKVTLRPFKSKFVEK